MNELKNYGQPHTPSPRWHEAWWGRLVLSIGGHLVVRGAAWLLSKY